MPALCVMNDVMVRVCQGDEFGEEGSFTVGSGDRPVGLDWSKTGPHAQMHQQMLIANFHDLNDILNKEPAFRTQLPLSLFQSAHWLSVWLSQVARIAVAWTGTARTTSSSGSPSSGEPPSAAHPPVCGVMCDVFVWVQVGQR